MYLTTSNPITEQMSTSLVRDECYFGALTTIV
jgi:hypothetical protein